MTVSEWNALRPGDIVVERRSRAPRMVLSVSRKRRFLWGKRRGQPYTVIELRKLRQGPFPCPNTLLAPYDWIHRLDVAHGKRGRVLREFFYCECHGWSHLADTMTVDRAWAAAHPRSKIKADRP